MSEQVDIGIARLIIQDRENQWFEQDNLDAAYSDPTVTSDRLSDILRADKKARSLGFSLGEDYEAKLKELAAKPVKTKKSINTEPQFLNPPPSSFGPPPIINFWRNYIPTGRVVRTESTRELDDIDRRLQSTLRRNADLLHQSLSTNQMDHLAYNSAMEYERNRYESQMRAAIAGHLVPVDQQDAVEVTRNFVEQSGITQLLPIMSPGEYQEYLRTPGMSRGERARTVLRRRWPDQNAPAVR